MSTPAAKQMQRAARVAELDAFKVEQGCADKLFCNPNATLSPTMLECDHLPGFTKRWNLAWAIRQLEIPMVEIWKEAGKCEVVCSLCHRARTDARR